MNEDFQVDEVGDEPISFVDFLERMKASSEGKPTIQVACVPRPCYKFLFYINARQPPLWRRHGCLLAGLHVFIEQGFGRQNTVEPNGGELEHSRASHLAVRMCASTCSTRHAPPVTGEFGCVPRLPMLMHITDAAEVEAKVEAFIDERALTKDEGCAVDTSVNECIMSKPSS
eukprot:3418378-Amphidinium_carterae.1